MDRAKLNGLGFSICLALCAWRLPKNWHCEMRAAGFVSPRCQGPWRFGRRTPPGLDRSNGSLSGFAADSLAALFYSAAGTASKTVSDDAGTRSDRGPSAAAGVDSTVFEVPIVSAGFKALPAAFNEAGSFNAAPVTQKVNNNRQSRFYSEPGSCLRTHYASSRIRRAMIHPTWPSFRSFFRCVRSFGDHPSIPP